MALTITQMLCSTDKYNIKCPYVMTPEYITVHNTANDASAMSEISYMINNNNQVSYHYAVDDTRAVQGIPLDRNTWNAGDGNSGTGNRKTIAIEICYSKSGGEKFVKSEQNAAYLIATLLKERGWDINRVKKHQDWSGKYCPHRTLDMGWQRFLNLIQVELSKATGITTTKKETTTSEIYRVRKSWTDTASQIGAYSVLENAKKACKDGYSVFDSNGNIVYTKDSAIPTSPTHKYSVGQHVVFSSSYPKSNSPCGVAYATSGAGNGKITAIVNGQAKYQIDNGIKYCNDGDIRGIYTLPTNTSSTSSTLKNTSTINVYYKVYAGGKWYSEVENLDDYAGDGKNPIKAIAIKTDNGSVKYRIHVKGGSWYPYVTGYNINDINNGYAGDCKKDIDMVEVCHSYKKAKYRVAPIGRDYYSWQYDNEKTNGCDGYAGAAGVSIGKFQIVIE